MRTSPFSVVRAEGRLPGPVHFLADGGLSSDLSQTNWQFGLANWTLELLADPTGMIVALTAHLPRDWWRCTDRTPPNGLPGRIQAMVAEVPYKGSGIHLLLDR